jgi:hypothetical protein
MEKFFGEIFLQAIEIFTLVVGAIGVFLSLLLLLAPLRFKKTGAILNRAVDIDSKITHFVDRDIPTDNLIYRHNIISGVCLMVASAFILVFLFYRLDVDGFLKVFFADREFNTIDEILFSSMALIGKIAGVIGMLIGSILLFSPEQMRQIEKRVDTWFATKPLWDKLDRPFENVDALVFRRPTVFGIIGLVTSLFLTFLAVKNLLD